MIRGRAIKTKKKQETRLLEMEGLHEKRYFLFYSSVYTWIVDGYGVISN